MNQASHLHVNHVTALDFHAQILSSAAPALLSAIQHEKSLWDSLELCLQHGFLVKATAKQLFSKT